MSEPIRAYPLTWPEGWRRTEAAARGFDRFGRKDRGSYGTRELTIAEAVSRVLTELERFGVPEIEIIISSNVRPTLSGVPSSKGGTPADPGVAVYWGAGKRQRCIAIDRYRSVAGNLGAIAATLEAMRAIERHGGAEILDRAFTGFTALPAPEQPWQVLGLGAHATRAEIEDAYRRLAMQHHPDRGGSDAEMARINAARDALLESLP